MSILQAIILGIIQGLTEFLPVSSSAHLVLTPYLLGWKIPAQEAFIFDVLVQVASLVAVIAYFWTDLMAILRAWLTGLIQRKPFADPQARLGWLLILATIPAGLAGLLIKDLVEQAFASPVATALFLFVTAGILTAAEYFSRQKREHGTAQLERRPVDRPGSGCFDIPGHLSLGCDHLGRHGAWIEAPGRGTFCVPDVHPDHAGCRITGQPGYGARFLGC